MHGFQVFLGQLRALYRRHARAHDQHDAVRKAAHDRRIGHDRDRRGIDNDKVIVFAQALEQAFDSGQGQHLAGVGGQRADRQQRELHVFEAHERFGHSALPGHDVGDARAVAVQVQVARQRAFAQIAVHQNDLFAARGQRGGQVDGDVALALLRHRRRDEDGLAAGRSRKELQVGAQRFIRFHELEGSLRADHQQFAVAFAAFFCIGSGHYFFPPFS